MKYTLFALPLAVTAAVLERTPAKVAGRVELEPRVRKAPGVKRTLTKFGPFELAGSTVDPADAHSGGHGGHGGHGGMSGMMGGMMGGKEDNTLAGSRIPMTIVEGFCNEKGPCTVHAGRVGIMFADTNEVATPEKGLYIHHVLTSDTTKNVKNFLTGCNSKTGRPGLSISSIGRGGTGFIGTGEDSGERPVLYTRKDGSSSSGFYIQKGDVFVADVQLVNYNKEPRKVYITYDLEYTDGETGSNTKGMLIGTELCMKKLIVSEEGPRNTTGGPFTFLEDGEIISMRGHLHDGGSQTYVSINDKHVCSTVATYGGGGSQKGEWKTISSMSMCDDVIPVKKGDKLVINVEYDLKKHPLRVSASGKKTSDEMGMLSVTFAPAIAAK